MTQSQFCLQFSEVIDIPEAHMKAFVVCNSSPTQIFYKLKDKILTKFGHENDYDLQIIKQTCWSCEGTGKFKPNLNFQITAQDENGNESTITTFTTGNSKE